VIPVNIGAATRFKPEFLIDHGKTTAFPAIVTRRAGRQAVTPLNRQDPDLSLGKGMVAN